MRFTFAMCLTSILAFGAGRIVAIAACGAGCKEIMITKNGGEDGQCVYFSDSTAKSSVQVEDGAEQNKIENYDPTETIKTYYKAGTCDECTHTCDNPQVGKIYEADGTIPPSGGTADCPEFNYTRQKCVPQAGG